jgi:hypothetical protein
MTEMARGEPRGWTRKNRARCVAQAEEQVPIRCKALSSNPGTTQKKQKHRAEPWGTGTIKAPNNGCQGQKRYTAAGVGWRMGSTVGQSQTEAWALREDMEGPTEASRHGQETRYDSA